MSEQVLNLKSLNSSQLLLSTAFIEGIDSKTKSIFSAAPLNEQALFVFLNANHIWAASLNSAELTIVAQLIQFGNYQVARFLFSCGLKSMHNASPQLLSLHSCERQSGCL